jgi:hypothetical protein
MRHGTQQRRQRNRGNGGNRPRSGGNSRMQVYDSNGPDVRIRGTAHQVAEKYMTLAKDAASAGDRTLAENYLQHAEHYQRIINSWEDSGHPVQGYSGQPRPEAQPVHGNSASDEDLSLPTSILGSAPKAESQENTRERTPEFTA